MSRRRLWQFPNDRHDAGRVGHCRCAGRPGLIGRYSARHWWKDKKAVTPEQLAKSGSEHAHQSAFMQALLQWSPTIYALTFAIPNGAALSERSKSPQARLTGAIRMNVLKAEGLKTGVPDVFVAWPQGNMPVTCGLFLEFKKAKGGVVGPDQEAWRAKLINSNYAVRTVYNWKEGLNAVAQYFGQQPIHPDAASGE